MIFLARHGETDDNAAGRVQGYLDSPLNDRGRDQARALAELAAGENIRALYSSHLVRAHETASIVGERLGLEPQVDERFAESRRGAWEGRLLTEIERDFPDLWAEWHSAADHFRFPGGESIAEHAARVEAGLADVARGALPALVIAHGGSIRCAFATRDPRGLASFQSLAVPNGELMRLPPGSPGYG